MDQAKLQPVEPLHKDWLVNQLSKSDDFVFREIRRDDMELQLLFLKSVVDQSQVIDYIFGPFYKVEEFGAYLASLPNVNRHRTNKETLDKIIHGHVLITHNQSSFLLELKMNRNGNPLEATVENVIQGPRNALSENLQVNMSLIRNRYLRPSLVIEQAVVGQVTPTPIAVVYDEEFVDQTVLSNVKKALAQNHSPIIQTTSQLHNLINRSKMSLFPTMLTTERPDRIALNLAQGKIVLLMEGTGFGLIIPCVFYDFMSSMEDLYQSYWVSKFFILIRYIGLLVSTTLASVYVALTSYNPEVLRVQLSLSIAGSRASVPYPSYIEVLFMLIMMEMLTEASIRLPKSIGSTATTVGGLILGQAATQAGLVSNIMIILVATVAIANFVIPINTMSFGMRVMKYVLLLITTMTGFMGLIVGFIGLIGYMASIDSFGKPYLKLFMDKPNPGTIGKPKRQDGAG